MNLDNINSQEKRLPEKFYIDFAFLLGKYIQPVSKELAREIHEVVENLIISKGIKYGVIAKGSLKIENINHTNYEE